MSNKTVYLIGVGGFGIHHLEGLLISKTPLDIKVIDASPQALDRARSVCDGVSSGHMISFLDHIPEINCVDVAIVATTSRVRAAVIRELLSKVRTVKYLLLEKILFDKKSDYASIGRLLKKHRTRAWVNCPRRLFPFHVSLQKKMRGGPFWLQVSAGERYGLMTNVIHYLDYMCYLAGTTDFRTDTSLLVPKLVESKRGGYHELWGSLSFHFKNESIGTMTTLPQPDTVRLSIAGKRARVIIDESKKVAMVAEKKTGWLWEQATVPLFNQSEMTGHVVETIIKTGHCDLTPYEESAAIHVALLEPVRRFLNKSLQKSVKNYPFT